MSSWTYINGVITVSPMGRTQHEKTYLLNTVLDHLPIVTGSENNMDFYIIQKNGHNSYSSCDEFGYMTNNLTDRYGYKTRYGGGLRTQREYIIVVEGKLRDREFSYTLREFNSWLCRLAKRISVESVLVEISSYTNQLLIKNNNDVYGKMFEYPSWSSGGKHDNSENWCEYLMWEEVEYTD